MKTTLYLTILVVSCLMFFNGCAYHKKEKPVDPCLKFTNISCDSSTKYVFNNVFTIMNDGAIGCNLSGCHLSGEAGVGAPELDTYDKLSAYVKDCTTREKFETSIKFEGAHPMPKGGTKMEDAKIQTILRWICQGAKK